MPSPEDYGNAVGLRGIDRLYVAVESIDTRITDSEQLRDRLYCQTALYLSGLGIQIVSIEEARDSIPRAYMMVTPAIIPLLVDGELAGYVFTLELALWQKVAPWTDPMQVMNAITWRKACTTVIRKADGPEAWGQAALEHLLDIFASDWRLAREPANPLAL